MDKFLIDGHKLIYHPDRGMELAEAGNDWEKHKSRDPSMQKISTSGHVIIDAHFAQLTI